MNPQYNLRGGLRNPSYYSYAGYSRNQANTQNAQIPAVNVDLYSAHPSRERLSGSMNPQYNLRGGPRNIIRPQNVPLEVGLELAPHNSLYSQSAPVEVGLELGSCNSFHSQNLALEADVHLEADA